ncbi:cyclin-like protein [Schizophyllum amplum]|uniref:Cyclin-like protein n=1 Tax=Schizophyllum amplum TaxID=97359 RepID=A0A550CJ54_9AGAR|nr:cyclin-like protein [Auriculariopsis ampla]
MATNNLRLPARRPGIHRSKGDENAIKQLRQPTALGGDGPKRFAAGAMKATRAALGEIPTAINRKNDTIPGKGKEVLKEEVGLKRGRPDSGGLPPQRIPLGPGRAAPAVAQTVNARPLRTNVARIPVLADAIRRASKPSAPEPVQQQVVYDDEPAYLGMDVENEMEDDEIVIVHDSVLAHDEEEMVGVESDDDEPPVLPSSSSPMVEKVPRMWPECSTAQAERHERELQAVRATFTDVDPEDDNMVSEYASEIFEYMSELEEELMPVADYMDGQNEITWAMRQTLIDWLLQVHLRYHLMPETLWIATNLIDRFLSKRVVSMVKLQLVGITAMFIAAKYEEILAPSVDEFVFMTEKGYKKEEILKGERIVLQTLDFKVSHYCSPYSWMRRISRADDYDIQTRTLSKFLIEITLLDHRFVRVKPSLIAAVGMYCARKMLGGDWNEAFVYHSGYTEDYLVPGHNMLVDKMKEAGFTRTYLYKKYGHKKFLKASIFATEWSRSQRDDMMN